MLPLLIGAICIAAAVHWRRSLRRKPWARWPAVAIAALALLALRGAAGSVDHYRFTLLGLRYRVLEPHGNLVQAPLKIGGDERTAEVDVPGVGKRELARLIPLGDSVVDSVRVETDQDLPAVVVVYHRRRFWQGIEPRVLGGTPFVPGDTLQVQARGDTMDFTVRARWGGGRDVILDVASGRELPLKGSRGATVFQRTYPLTDVIAQFDSAFAEGVPLGSFFYYADHQLHFVDIDSEVEGGTPASDLVWSREGGSRQMLVAGLAHRDFPDLPLPQRYGIRPLRSGRVRVSGPWLDFFFASPEVRTFGRHDLHELSLPPPLREDRAEEKPREYAVRLSPESDNFARRAVTFTTPPAHAAAQGHAIFHLPLEPSAARFRILGPAGTVAVEAGTPFALEDGRRGLLMRVDGQALSAGSWLLLVLLFGPPVALLATRPLPATASLLALVALALGALRLLLGLSAHLEFPYSQESLQIALWLVPLLPWAVVLASGKAPTEPRLDLPHLVYLGWMLFLTWSLFADAALLKQLMLGGAPVGLWIFFRHPHLLPRRRGSGAPSTGKRWRAFLRIPRMLPAAETGASADAPAARRSFLNHLGGLVASWPGVTAGTALLVARGVMDGLNWEESITLGSTRLALSVFYTPGSLLLFARAMVWHGRRLETAAGTDPTRYGQTLLRSLVDLIAFPLLAYGGTAAAVNDFGIALINLPAALLFLGLWLRAWAAPRGATRAALWAAALPLAVFGLLQGAPELVAPSAEVHGAEARLQRWSNNRLRLVERGDPEVLRQIGQRRSEALGIMSETMRSYTRGNWEGVGFLHGEVSPELRATATQEHVASALLAAQWGLAGVAGVLLLIFTSLAPLGAFALPRLPGAFTSLGIAAVAAAGLWIVARVLPYPLDVVVVGGVLVGTAVRFVRQLWTAPAPVSHPGRARAEATSFPAMTTGLFLFTFASTGVYIVLANYGVVFFTGKNIYLLGLDSVSDVFESLILLCGATWALRVAAPVIASARNAT